MIPCSYRASTCLAALPSCIASYAVSARQTRGFPSGLVFSPKSGFLQIPPRDGHPCLRLYPSHYWADSRLSLVRNVRRRAHMQTGSSPAYAGKTTPVSSTIRARQDHPRIRGENSITHALLPSFLGSPPHTRGKLALYKETILFIRITPAYAGKTLVEQVCDYYI